MKQWAKNSASARKWLIFNQKAAQMGGL